MGLRQWIFGEQKNAQVLDILPSIMLTPDSKTGISVGMNSALTVTTVLACVRLIANGIAQVPLKAYVRSEARVGRLKRINHPLLDVLGWKPNPWQTAFEFFQTLLLHLLLCGNAFVFKSIVDGKIAELIIIEPRHVVMHRLRDMSIIYEISSDEGGSRRMTAREIWHIRGLSLNGWAGIDIVKLTRESIGLALATEETHALLHKNGAQSGGVLSLEGNVDAANYTKLQQWVQDQIGGANKHKPLIMDHGAKWYGTRMTGVDSEHLATRRFQIEENCRALGVIPMMIGSTEKTPTFASAEQMLISHVVNSLTPWARCLELSAEINLLDPEDDVDLVFDMKGLMRGASKDRGEYNAKALGAGGTPAWATQNEIRAEEGLDWHPDGDGLSKGAMGTPPATEGNA